MNIKKLETLEEFENLKKGDLIIVEWHKYFVSHHKNSKTEMAYRIHSVKPNDNEIICQLKDNHYFNYKMHLGLDTPGKNTSNAREVYLVEEYNERSNKI